MFCSHKRFDVTHVINLTKATCTDKVLLHYGDIVAECRNCHRRVIIKDYAFPFNSKVDTTVWTLDVVNAEFDKNGSLSKEYAMFLEEKLQKCKVSPDLKKS